MIRPKITFIGRHIADLMLRNSFFLLRCKLQAKGIHDRRGDLILDGEDILQFAVVLLRPKMIAVSDVDELSRDSHAALDF